MAEPQGIGQTAEEKAAAEAYIVTMQKLSQQPAPAGPPFEVPNAEAMAGAPKAGEVPKTPDIPAV
jgi:hypothetical protein